MTRRALVALLFTTAMLFTLIPTITYAQTTTWAPTATQAIPLASASSLGSLTDNTPIHIGVVLQLNNRQNLIQLVQSQNDPTSPLYGSELDETTFLNTYGPTPAQVNAVVGYLTSQSFTNIAVESNNLIVQADGTAASVSAAFNTRLEQFQQNGATVFANTAPAQVPTSLAGIAVAVLGLSNAGVMKTPLHPAAGVPTYPFASYYPKDLWKAYDVGSTPTGANTSIAVFAEGDVSQVLNDLKVARTTEGLPQVPVTVIRAGIPSPDTAGVPEWDIDTQSSTGMAGTVSHLYLYVATSMTDTDLTYAFNKFVSKKLARAGNGSFGLCEIYPFLDGNMLADDNIFLQAAAQGQTVFFSTGDTGSFCPAQGLGVNGVPAGAPLVNCPACSAYAVAVGGTSLLTNSDGSYNNEIAWNAGGGGISQFEYSPYWQAGAVPSNAANSKGLPDIAMDADPNSGEMIYMSCQPPLLPTQQCTAGWGQWGGTSLASPLAMGVWARLQSAHHNTLGFASPKLYRGAKLATSTTPLGYHDITVGNNGIYSATPGWDYTTGLGSFDVSAINAVIH